MLNASTFKKIVFILLSMVVFAYLGRALFIYFKSKEAAKISQKVDIDTYADLQIVSPLFAQGVQEVANGNYTQAVSLFMESKGQAKTSGEKSVIDFNIAAATFNLNRASGTDAFSSLSKNENYTNRTRALAMIRAYLMYAKYSDNNVLKQLAADQGIQWTTRKDVINAYFIKVYNLYPFALPAVHIAGNEIDKATTKEEALAVYLRYEKSINASILQMKGNSGELTEVTSSMLGQSDLLGKLYLKFKAIPKEQVEKSYEDLINYDQEKNVKSNKQYALLSYANFESGADDYVKATEIVRILLKESLETSLAESLPKLNVSIKYPYFQNLLKNETDTSVKSFIVSIGSKYER